MARNGALANEHANFRTQLKEQLGAEEAARRILAIRQKLAQKRRGPLTKAFYNSRKLPRSSYGGGRRTRRRR